MKVSVGESVRGGKYPWEKVSVVCECVGGGGGVRGLVVVVVCVCVGGGGVSVGEVFV